MTGSSAPWPACSDSRPAHAARPAKPGGHNEAVTCCERALVIDPNRTDILVRKAYSLSRLGRHNDAVICCEKALKKEPDNADALAGMVSVQAWQGLASRMYARRTRQAEASKRGLIRMVYQSLTGDHF